MGQTGQVRGADINTLPGHLRFVHAWWCQEGTKIIVMNAIFRVFVLIWMGIAATAIAGGPVAIVAGHEIGPEDLGRIPDAGARSAELARLVRKQLFLDYVEIRGLAATPDEIEELHRYDAEFERKDRAQRRRKLVQLNARLASGGLDDAERGRLTEFRDILQRMATVEALADSEAPGTPPDGERTPWIELWKMHRALYEEYGGEVLLVEYGPYPKGAWLRLLADYERAGNLQFSDRTWRDRVFAQFESVAGVRLPPGAVDFTPYWKKPIPSSYFPDHVPEPAPGGS